MCKAESFATAVTASVELGRLCALQMDEIKSMLVARKSFFLTPHVPANEGEVRDSYRLTQYPLTFV